MSISQAPLLGLLALDCSNVFKMGCCHASLNPLSHKICPTSASNLMANVHREGLPYSHYKTERQNYRQGGWRLPCDPRAEQGRSRPMASQAEILHTAACCEVLSGKKKRSEQKLIFGPLTSLTAECLASPLVDCGLSFWAELEIRCTLICLGYAACLQFSIDNITENKQLTGRWRGLQQAVHGTGCICRASMELKLIYI